MEADVAAFRQEGEEAVPEEEVFNDSATVEISFATEDAGEEEEKGAVPAVLVSPVDVCPICLEDFEVPPPPPALTDLDATGTEDSMSSSSSSLGDIEMGTEPVELSSWEGRDRLVLPCGHTFCRPCLAQYLEVAVVDKALPMTCPDFHCDALLPDEAIPLLFASMTTANADRLKSKYERTILLKNNSSLVECTQCSLLFASDGHHHGRHCDKSHLQCPDCGHAFCREHGDMHPGMTCADFFASAQGETLKRSEEALKECTKPCTRCGALLQKSQGCNVVRCGNCRGDFCYKCETHEKFVTTRFHRTCTGCNTAHTLPPNDCTGKLYLIFQCIMSILIYVIALFAWLPLILPIFVLSCGCCCCCCWPYWKDNQNAKGIKWNLLFLLFWPYFILIDGVLVGCFGRQEFFWAHLDKESQAPELPFLEVATSHSETINDSDQAD